MYQLVCCAYWKFFLVVIDRQIRKKPQISVRVGIKYREGMLKKCQDFIYLQQLFFREPKPRRRQRVPILL